MKHVANLVAVEKKSPTQKWVFSLRVHILYTYPNSLLRRTAQLDKSTWKMDLFVFKTMKSFFEFLGIFLTQEGLEKWLIKLLNMNSLR